MKAIVAAWARLAMTPLPKGLGWPPAVFWGSTLAEIRLVADPLLPPSSAEIRARVRAGFRSAESMFAQHDAAMGRVAQATETPSRPRA